MKRSSVPTLARLAAASAVLGLILALSLGAPATALTPTAEATPTPEPTASAPATSAPTTSTPEKSIPATFALKPRPKGIDKRPKAPKFIPRKGKAVFLNRKKQRVYLYVNGRQIKKWKCSTSRTLPGRGKYHMTRKRKQSWSFSGSVTFYWQVIFTVGPQGHNIAFHSIPEDHSGHEIAPVGKPISHGCVRLKKKNAKFLYRWINKRVPIIVRP